MKIAQRILLFVLITAGLTQSCSRKKNTFTRRAYHNTTSHYNYYFNARELMKKHLDGIQTGYADDYNYILPIFVYGTEAQSEAAYESMEEIIKKCSKLIDRHSIYIKKDEYNRWVDLSYLLVGEAKFYKREYYGALEIFRYVTYAFKTKPSFYEANIWIARTYIEMEDYREAEDVLESVKEGDLPDEHKGEYYAIYADLYYKQNDNEQAAFYLKQAVENTRKLQLRRRYTYILAQLYHDRKDYASATKYYGKVLKMRPEYVMAFNAKLNQARAYDPSANNSESIKKRLNRMLRDKKNLEYRDQIYFALAELSFREEDEEQGMEYLRLAAASSVSNNKVKSEAYMMLGNIYYDKPKYITAHAYYDSCVTIIPENHQKKEFVTERKESLDDLVDNVKEIELQDSLQMIAAMDEKDRDKMIRKIIREVERQEEREREALARGFAQSYELANKRNDQAGGGLWYFYNQSVKSFGVSEFRKTWGDRPLEDDWRRSDKSTEVKFAKEEVEEEVDSVEAGITNKDPEFYLNQLPLSDSALAVSHNTIIVALYNAGNIYREDFQDYPSAIECFDRLTTQYDTCRFVESSWYQMYRIYLMTDETSEAARCKAHILKNYPYSEYARIIKNPEYLKNKRDRNEQIEAYYKATYQLYDYEMYADVMDHCEKSKELFGDNHMTPQFDYLKALAVGKSKSKHQFRTALEEVIASHPTNDVATSAEKIIEKMDEVKQEKEQREAIYKKNFRDEHVFVVMVPNYTNEVNTVKLALSDYNRNNKGQGTLNVNSVLFSGELQMISVKSFKDKQDGMVYIQNISQYPDFENAVVKNDYDRFLISTENFAYFFKQKNVEEYLSFYDDYYLKK